jgi:hypothetical protein
MITPRRWLRNLVSDLFGVQGDIDILWTPHEPIIYVNNPKSGCSTIKHSLKAAEAREYEKSGKEFKRLKSPHQEDDCLKKNGLRISMCSRRFIISCVRNPYTRALSCFLDKIERKVPRTPRALRVLRNRGVKSFEQYLFELSRLNPRDLDPHFRPQHINLNFPNISYDRVFFLENTKPLSAFLDQLSPGLQLKTFAPHSHSSNSRIRSYYTDRSSELVRSIYANDFLSFGYSNDLDDVDFSPAEFIANNRLVSASDLRPDEAPHSGRAASCRTFQATLRYRQLIELHLI